MDPVSVKTSKLMLLLNRADNLGRLSEDRKVEIRGSVQRNILVPSQFFVDLVNCNKELVGLVKENQALAEYMDVPDGEFLPHPNMRPNPYAKGKQGNRKDLANKVVQPGATQSTEQPKSALAKQLRQRTAHNTQHLAISAEAHGTAQPTHGQSWADLVDAAAYGQRDGEEQQVKSDAQQQLAGQNNAATSGQRDALQQRAKPNINATEAAKTDAAVSGHDLQGADRNGQPAGSFSAPTAYGHMWPGSVDAGSRWAQMPVYQYRGDPYGLYHPYGNWMFQPPMVGQTMQSLMMSQAPMSAAYTGQISVPPNPPSLGHVDAGGKAAQPQTHNN